MLLFCRFCGREICDFFICQPSVLYYIIMNKHFFNFLWNGVFTINFRLLSDKQLLLQRPEVAKRKTLKSLNKSIVELFWFSTITCFWFFYEQTLSPILTWTRNFLWQKIFLPHVFIDAFSGWHSGEPKVNYIFNTCKLCSKLTSTQEALCWTAMALKDNTYFEMDTADNFLLIIITASAIIDHTSIRLNLNI